MRFVPLGVGAWLCGSIMQSYFDEQLCKGCKILESTLLLSTFQLLTTAIALTAMRSYPHTREIFLAQPSSDTSIPLPATTHSHKSLGYFAGDAVIVGFCGGLAIILAQQARFLLSPSMAQMFNGAIPLYILIACTLRHNYLLHKNQHEIHIGEPLDERPFSSPSSSTSFIQYLFITLAVLGAVLSPSDSVNNLSVPGCFLQFASTISYALYLVGFERLASKESLGVNSLMAFSLTAPVRTLFSLPPAFSV